jgi:hypothetical protein
MADNTSFVEWMRIALYGVSSIASLGAIVTGSLSEVTSDGWETAFIG